MAQNSYRVEATREWGDEVMHIIQARTAAAAADRMRAAYGREKLTVTSVTRLARGEDAA